MDLGILTDNKLISMVLQGYTPFQPEVGIFCGAYVGILYPNPTTLSYPGFNPYRFLDITATEFNPSTRYTGLGIGNPGIDYKNPGHLLGIFDTFGRMSYGIAVWQAIFEGQNGETSIDPVIQIVLPMVDENFEDASLVLDDIYPSLTEAPSAYLDHFFIDSFGRTSPDPRPGIVFRPMGVGITPVTNPVNTEAFQRLFQRKSIFSHLGMAQYFRAAIEDLSTSAQSLTSKVTHTFSLSDIDHWGSYSNTNFLDTLSTDVEFNIVSAGTFVSECKVMDATQALKTLTNSSVYHNGDGGQNEYRTFTELNSVVNLVPMQMFGGSYTKHYIDGNNNNLPNGGTGFLISSFAYFDFVINVSDVPPGTSPSPGEVTIAGEVTVKNLITNGHALDWRQIRQAVPAPLSNLLDEGWAPNEDDGSFTDQIFSGAETVNKDAFIQISSTNDAGWDKVWLDAEAIDESIGFSDNLDLHRDAGTDLTPLDSTPLVVPFGQTVTLGAGATSIRVRVKARTEHFLMTDGLVFNLWVDPENSGGPNGTLPEDSQFCHEHVILDGFEFVVDFHCHFYLNVLNNFYLGDPMIAAENIQEAPFTVSLTVNGTRLDDILYTMSS